MKTKIRKSILSKMAISLFMALFFISCDKDSTETDETSAPEQSQSVKILTEYIREIYGSTNNLASRSAVKSPEIDLSDLLKYDFCFNFVYPVTLSYNNGTTVVVNGDDQLLTIAQSMTDSLYINGIQFPFDVILSDGTSRSIQNETQFEEVMHACDTDGDGSPNYEDYDDDNDGLPDDQEDIDQDGNTLNDDTDQDGTPNYQDSDDDNDGVPTAEEDIDNDENPSNDDTDNDGTPNYLDDDDDNDGIPTANEDHDHDGNVSNDDSDGDGVSDYLDTDSDNDGIDDGDDPDSDGDGVEDDQEENDDD